MVISKLHLWLLPNGAPWFFYTALLHRSLESVSRKDGRIKRAPVSLTKASFGLECETFRRGLLFEHLVPARGP